MKARLELTLAAQRQAEKQEILSLLEAFEPPPNLMKGDVLEFTTPSGSESFVVRSRHFRFADGDQELSIRIDYSAR